jgi:hypothetical protein
MKKVLKVVGYLLLLVAIAIGGLLTYVKAALPNVGEAEDLKIEYTPERIERGRYLAHSVTVCMDCHATRDWSKFSGPPTPGTLGTASIKVWACPEFIPLKILHPMASVAIPMVSCFE